MDQTFGDSCMSWTSRCSKAGAHVTLFPVMPIFCPNDHDDDAMIDDDDDDDDAMIDDDDDDDDAVIYDDDDDNAVLRGWLVGT